MNKTFYQFTIATAHETHEGVKRDEVRAAIVSAGDAEEARDFLMNPKMHKLGVNQEVHDHPIVTHWLPDDMVVMPVDTGDMRTCWAGHRILDYVYGLGIGAGPPPPDGVIVMPSKTYEGAILVDDTPQPRPFAPDLFVVRACAQADCTIDELVRRAKGMGKRFAGWRVRAAMKRAVRAKRICAIDPYGRGKWRSEPRRTA